MATETTEKPNTKTPRAYTAKDIQVLEGREAVRTRPAMYISNTGALGLHHLVWEVMDNSIDEAMGGYAKKVDVVIHFDNSISIVDDGRGIPVEAHPDPKMGGKSTLEIVMTVLHAGGKFDNEAYQYSAGLHGVGVSVVTFLSEWLEAEVKRDGGIWYMRFEKGLMTEKLKQIGQSKKTGTRIRFKPDAEIFETVEFSYDTLAVRFREMAFLNAGVLITLSDERTGKNASWSFKGGVAEFVKQMNASKKIIHPKPIYLMKSREFERKERDGTVKPATMHLELGIQYNDGFDEQLLSFANNVNTRDGGSHVSGFRKALTRTINDYANKNGLLKNFKQNLEGTDMREGVTTVISVKIPNPQFGGAEQGTAAEPGGRRLGAADDQRADHGIFRGESAGGAAGRGEMPECGACTDCGAQGARDRAQERDGRDQHAAGEAGGLFGARSGVVRAIPGRGATRRVARRSRGRDRHFQAILPLRGKIINVEKARLDRILGNNEIRTMVTALGTGIGGDNFDVSKLRYHKIIIMTDADVDGAHIRTLLLTFYFRQMRELVEQGYVYIAQPPLFLVRKGKQQQYLDSEQERDRYLLELAVDSIRLEYQTRGNGKAPVEVSKAHLKALIEDIIALATLEPLLARKAVPLRRLLELRGDGGKLPRYMVTFDGEPHFAYTEKELASLIEELDQRVAEAEEAAGDTAEAGPDETDQPDMLESAELDQADAEPEAAGPKHDVVELPEAETVEAIIGRAEKLGIPADLIVHQEFEIDPKNPFEEYHPFTVLDGEKRGLAADSLPEVLERVREIGAKGVHIQRYKGLGEMNAEELWETTMNPATRRLLRVALEDTVEADRIFTILMGDQVDPRRRFIQQNAPEVRNLDL